MRYQLLSIGLELKNQSCTNSSFFDAPALCDFDVVIIDPLVLRQVFGELVDKEKLAVESDGRVWSYYKADGGLGLKLKASIERRRDEIKSLLDKTGGTLVVILRGNYPTINLKEYDSAYSQKTGEICIYSWMPRAFPAEFLARRDGFVVGDFNDKDIWGRFFRVFNTDVRYEVILRDSTPPVKGLTKIATNKAAETISFQVQEGKGNIIFLPPIKTDKSDAWEGILIDAIRGQFRQAVLGSPPQWLDQYKMPTEGKNKDGIAVLEQQIKTLIVKKSELQKKEDDVQNLKGLLYEQGKHGLEPLVRGAFRLLGFNVLDPDEYDEPYDLYIVDETISIIGEIEGSVKQIGVEKYRQLFDYVDKRLSEGEKSKGILIGNGFLEEDPELRGEQFSPEALGGCERQGFCALTTFELYKVIALVLANNSDEEIKTRLREDLLKHVGKYQFGDQAAISAPRDR